MLTSAQLATLKAAIAANVATIPAGQPWTGAFSGVAVNAIPNTNSGGITVAGWYNQNTSPAYFVWKSSVSRAVIYTTIDPDNGIWDWNAYKTQSNGEQNAWVQMFMGDTAPIGNLNLRDGIFKIFTGSAPQNAQRAHIFAVGRRNATYTEKLFAIAPASAGGITVGPNNGNTIADALGAATNPAVMVFEGNISTDDVQNANNLP